MEDQHASAEPRTGERTVTFGVASSLDNFIAREDHSVDWLSWSDEVGEITARFWKTIDTVVMGRKTYEVAVASGTTAYPGVRNYVFSRSMTEAPDDQVEIVSGDAAEFIRELKRRRGKGSCVLGAASWQGRCSRWE